MRVRRHEKFLSIEKSIDQHRSLTNVRPILDLSNEELGDVRARDDPVSPLGGIGNNLVASYRRSTCQNSRPRDRPILPALLDQTLLQTLVAIGSTKDDLERQPLQAADARAAIASSKTGHTDQTFDAMVPVPSGMRLEFSLARSPGNMKVSFQAARSIG